MKKNHSPVVGLSITEGVLHAVAVRPAPGGGNGVAEVTHVASALVPAGVIADGRTVEDPALLANTIRQMFTAAGITARDVVLGLPSRAVITRNAVVPPVPEVERRALVRGEIDHLNVLPPGQGTFDYAVLSRNGTVGSGGTSSSAAASKGEKGDSVVFYAVEPQVVAGYQAAAAAAGLRIIGMEPSDYAAIRAAYPRLAAQPLAVAISLGTNHTGLMFFRDGAPVYARRLDVGIADMSPGEGLAAEHAPMPAGVGASYAEASAAAAEPLGEMPEFLAGGRLGGSDTIDAASFWKMFGLESEPGAPTPEIGGGSAAAMGGPSDAARLRFVAEVGRSLDYFGREHADDLSGLSAVLLPNVLDLAGLHVYATAALEQDIEFCPTFDGVRIGPGLPSAEALRQEEGVAYAPALGLALGPVQGTTGGLPALDLSLGDLLSRQAGESRRVLLFGAGAAAVAVAVGAFASIAVDARHAPVARELAATRTELAQLTQREQETRLQHTQQLDMVRRIRAQNVAWTNVLRHLSLAVPSGIGITLLSEQGGAVSIAGETLDPNRVPDFWGRMNTSRFFDGTELKAISRSDNKVTFQMTARLPAAGGEAPQQ